MTSRMLVVAPVAQDDLRDIYRYGLRTWGGRQADDYLEQFRDCFWMLTTRHDAGRSRAELGRDLRSFRVRQHVVFYRLAPGQLQIVRVLHARQDTATVFIRQQQF